LRKNYLAMIEKSEGTRIFQHRFAIDENGKVKDLTERGRLSCAFFVSSILYLCGLISKIHLTVKSTIKDLKKCGWFETSQLKKGCILLWGKKKNHYHLGFYLGNKKAISNSPLKRKPIIHHFTFKGKRKIEKIFWHKKLDNQKL